MHCGNCVARVAKALTSVRGVEVDSLSIGHATIRIEPGVGEITNVLGAMARAGYPAEVTSGSK
jgi:copper chaperone CopZ